jgi:hypothetical protein
MKKLIYFFFISLIYSCGSDGNSGSDGNKSKIRLDENLTYKVFLDKSTQKNKAVASVFETINESQTDVLNAEIDAIILNASMFKFTGTANTVSGIFSDITTGLTEGIKAVNAGVKSVNMDVREQLAILHDLEVTYNEKVSSKINSDLKELVINLYPLEYLFIKHDILELDDSEKTVNLFKKNLKLNEYLINDLVPAYRDVIKSFNKLNQTVVLNKLNKSQVDSLKLQILSFDDDFGPFENRGSIKNFKNNYIKFSEITDLKKSNISAELDFLNQKTVNAINAYISSQNTKIKKMISFLGANDLVSVKKVLIGDDPIMTIKKYENHYSIIRDKKIKKILSKLTKK